MKNNKLKMKISFAEVLKTIKLRDKRDYSRKIAPLKKTKDSNTRFCEECNKNVYKCRTGKDIDKHIKLNHCIAIDEPNMPMGMIANPEFDIKE